MSAKAHFSITIQAIRACDKVRTHCFSNFMSIQETSMAHKNIHCAHQSIRHSTYKHSFSHQSISHGKYKHSFSYHNILHCTHKTFMLHTIAYCIAHTKHSYLTPVYKTRLNLAVCHLCIRFLLSVPSISLRCVA